MFKRFLAICLCVVAFVFSIIPVSASSFRCLNLLAYGGGNGVGQTVFVANPGVTDITFPVPSNSSGYTFDMLFSCGSSSYSVQLIINGSVFNCQLSHGPNYSSAFCNFSAGGFNSVIVRINNFGSASLFTVLSADINQFSTSGATVSCSLSGRVSDGTTNLFAYTGSPVTSNFGNLSSSLTGSVEWNVKIPFSSWSTGDFFKLNFYCSVNSITSVNAFLGSSSSPVEFEVSPWNNSTSDVGWSMYHVTVSVDLSEIRKTEASSSNLIIIISCSAARNASSSFTLTHASTTTLYPVSCSAVFDTNSTFATAAILANASPLNPIDVTLFKSSADLILLVACLSNAISKSSCAIPLPLSLTFIKEIPPFFISTVIDVAPASIEFSTISFTTEAGLSITSPAAILFIVKSSSNTIFPIFILRL